MLHLRLLQSWSLSIREAESVNSAYLISCLYSYFSLFIKKKKKCIHYSNEVCM